MFTSILDLRKTDKNINGSPIFFQDLNLDRILDAVQYCWKRDIRKYFYYFPADEASEDYRREIYKDICTEEIFLALMNFVELIEKSKEASEKINQVEIEAQKAVWKLWEIYYYCRAVENLSISLENSNFASSGLNSLRNYLKFYVDSNSFKILCDNTYDLYNKLCDFKLVLSFENNMINLSQGDLEGAYDEFLNTAFPEHEAKLVSPFVASPQLSALEAELISIFAKKNASFFMELESLCKSYVTYGNETFFQLYEELGFYLAFRKFQDKMQQSGFDFSFPTVDESQDVAANGLYDLALACVNIRNSNAVVTNDMFYNKKEQFFVVSGPNQGGKTTFARSLGQLIYFTKMGLTVPALDSNLHYFSTILTHFSVEESIATGKGKLKEELDRLAPMMCASYENAFVIINELFTTAANYDACIMGKRVLEHFIARKCMGIYVTHLKELSEDNPAVVSMKAQVEFREENGRKRALRKYKILRNAADEMGYADDIVDKHQLRYEQMKQRLSRSFENEG